MNQAPLQPQLNANGFVPCPLCRSDWVAIPTWTMWGGLIGQRLLGYAKCEQCGHGFIGKTGASATGRIAIYYLVVFGLAFGLWFAATM